MNDETDEATKMIPAEQPIVSQLVDITHLVTGAAKNHLNESTTPFLADMATFRLNDAMSATQLMDPIMDCCQIPGNLIAPWNDANEMIFPRPLPTCLDDPMTPLLWDTLTVGMVKVIAVHCLVRLQSFLSGSSAGDSIFTCLYAHYGVLNDMLVRLIGDPNDEEEASLLKAMERLRLNEETNDATAAQWALFTCTAYMVELAEKIRVVVQKADIYEEEDFVVQTHNLCFFAMQNPATDLPAVLKHTLQLLKNGSMDEDKSVLILVLEYQSCLFQACCALERLSIASRLQNITQAQALITKGLSRLDSLSNAEVANDPSSQNEELLQQCFDNFIARQLVGNLPIRKTSFVSPKQSFSILREITAQLEYGVCQFHLRGATGSLGRIFRSLRPFFKYNILARSLMLLNLYFEDHLLGVHSLPRLIADHIKQHCYYNEPSTLAVNENATSFYQRLAKPIYDILKLSLLTEPRQRGYLEAAIIPDWSVLQNEAKIADVQCSTPHHSFYYYALLQTVQLMERFVQTGISTGLFHPIPTDLAFAFWYRDCLLATRHQYLSIMHEGKETLGALELHQQQQLQSPARKEPTKSGKGKKKNQSQKKANKQKQKQQTALVRTAEDQEEAFALQIIALKRNLCRKTLQFISSLTQAGVFPATDDSRYEFTSLATIFGKRFEPFQSVEQPPPQPYEHFREGTDFSQYAPDQLQRYVEEGFQSCRSSIEILLVELSNRVKEEDDQYYHYGDTCRQELQALRKVCVGNGVYLQKLRQANDAELTKLQATFDFAAHPEFCIIKLSNSSS